MSLLLIPRILWGAFTMTQLLFVGLLLFLRSQGSVADEPVALVMPLAFAAESVALAVMSFVLPARLFRKQLLAGKQAIEERPDPDAVGMYRQSAPKVRFFANPEEAKRQTLPGYLVSFILAIAMAEAIGINGLVLGILGAELWQALPFFAMGTILIVLRFPREATLVQALEQAYQAKLG